jgi:mRNA interferase MazF
VFEFGTIALARFPFTDLSGAKSRPVLIVSRDNERCSDVVVCLITSVPRTGPDVAVIDATEGTGLKVRSTVRFDKLATLEKSLRTGRVGNAQADWLDAQKATFFGVFGFGS